MAAVTNDGDALQYASSSLQEFIDVVVAAVTSKPESLRFCNEWAKSREGVSDCRWFVG